MTAYDRSKGAFYGCQLGMAMQEAQDAIRELPRTPGESEVEESIGYGRTNRIVTSLRKALRAAEMLRFISQSEDTREVKRLE